jgi:hypothetical protein
MKVTAKEVIASPREAALKKVAKRFKLCHWWMDGIARNRYW